MRLQTVNRIVLAFMLAGTAAESMGQSAAASWPDQTLEIVKGGDEITTETKNNNEKYGEITVEIHAIAQIQQMLDKWNAEYNQYLTDEGGLVRSLGLSNSIYLEGVTMVENLVLLKRAITKHPEGLAASVPMNNLYCETIAIIVKCFNTLKRITKGTAENMLTGRERLDLFEDLSHDMKDLNVKLRKTAISIAYYNLMDIWNMAISGMGIKDHKMIADECLGKWKDAYKASEILSSD